jgi:hypothetical protein
MSEIIKQAEAMTPHYWYRSSSQFVILTPVPSVFPNFVQWTNKLQLIDKLLYYFYIFEIIVSSSGSS